MITDQEARHIAENPDGCDASELFDLFGYVRLSPYRAARRLWGVAPGFRPVIAVRMLGDYLCYAIHARLCRKYGRICKAQTSEIKCDAIYNTLPREIRW